MKNLSQYEVAFRITIGALIVALSVHFQFWWLFPVALVLLYSGAFGVCPIYNLMGVNIEEARKNFYIAQLPKYNPEPVYLFNRQGDVQYKNGAADTVLPELEKISELSGPDEHSAIEHIKNNANFFRRFESGDLSYLVHFKGVSEIDSILAYAFNVTDIVRINEEIINTQKELVYRMGEIGETRSKETGYHVKRVAEYSYTLARLLGIDEEESEILRMASPMHDIGKVGIPDSILKKPGRLDADEWTVMKTHSDIGYDLLKQSDRPILKAAALIAQQHHEKWNGEGYPNGRQQEDIHIYGRITAIADVFDALGSERVYKKAWPLDKILELFKEEKGKHFDPRLIELFLANLDPFMDIQKRYRDMPIAA